MKNFPNLGIPLIFTNLMVLASFIFTVPNVINNKNMNEELNRRLRYYNGLDINDPDLRNIGHQIDELENNLNEEQRVRNALLNRIHNIGLNHVILNARGEINLSEEDIRRIRGIDLAVVEQVELNRRRLNETEREIINFIIQHPRVIDNITAQMFLDRGEISDTNKFMLAVNRRFLNNHSPYVFSRQLVSGPIIDAGWRHMYHDIVVERPEDFRNGSRLYEELQRLFPWGSNAPSRDTFAEHLSHGWGSAIRYRNISDAARNTLAIIVRLLNDPNALTQQQRENILGVAREDIENHDDACHFRTEMIITNMATIIDQTLNVDAANNIHNVRELNDLVLSSWRQATVLNGANENVGVHERNSNMMYLSAALNVPFNGLHERGWNNVAGIINPLVDRNIVSISSICGTAQMTFASINNNELLAQLDQHMSNIPISFNDFKKCVFTYDKYSLEGLTGSAEQYAEQKTKNEILNEVIERRQISDDEQNRRAERIRLSVENSIMDALRNFEMDIRGLPVVNVVVDQEGNEEEINRRQEEEDRQRKQRNQAINIIAEQIQNLIQNNMPERDIQNLGSAIVNRAVNAAKTNVLRNLHADDNQQAVINRAIRRVITGQGRRGAALQAADKEFRENYKYNLPDEVARINNSKREMRDLIVCPDATIESRLRKYINNYLGEAGNARNIIESWMDGRANMSMSQIVELLPDIEINKYLIPEFVPNEKPNIYRANILYIIYLISQGYILPQ